MGIPEIQEIGEEIPFLRCSHASLLRLGTYAAHHQMMILLAAGIQTDLGLLKVPDNVCYLSTKGEKNETSQIYDCLD